MTTPPDIRGMHGQVSRTCETAAMKNKRGRNEQPLFCKPHIVANF